MWCRKIARSAKRRGRHTVPTAAGELPEKPAVEGDGRRERERLRAGGSQVKFINRSIDNSPSFYFFSTITYLLLVVFILQFQEILVLRFKERERAEMRVRLPD
ncbi:hypothetical protein Ancab_025896 [Ancistrocladus abbreviatus]